MKFLDRLGLALFSTLILILSILTCMVIFGWLPLDMLHLALTNTLSNSLSTNILLALSVLFILLAIKCIFFVSDKKEINGVKDGILLKNAEGKLVISKATLEELVNNIVRGFDSAQNPNSKIMLDNDNNLIVSVILNVKETAVIKELSTNLQTKIKSAIKKTSDLEVKEVNISIRELQIEKQNEEE